MKIEGVQLEKHLIFESSQQESSFSKCAMLRFEFIVPEDEQYHVPLHIAVLPEVFPTTSDSVSQPVTIQTKSWDALPLVRDWLQKCNTHQGCSQSHDAVLPTRIISTAGNKLHLCLATDLYQKPNYATLSHCWGSLTTTTLTKANISEFLEEIPESALTTTFKDAIEVARYLGVGYLWIDSLCILQDDLDDWAKESAKMSTVYGNSFLNIAATGAADGTKGLFMGPKDSRRCFRAWKSGDDHQNTAFHCVPLHDYTTSITDAPLLQRGWVVQERLLSPRTLHCTSSQMFWECNTMLVSEAFREMLHPGFLTLEMSAGPAWQKQPLDQCHWHDIVELYSACKLTLKKDKLSAVSGIARQMQKSCEGKYLAGLWGGKDLPWSLCWRCSEGYLANRPAYRAPTWSWAATDSRVYFPSAISTARASGVLTYLVELSSAQTVTPNEGPYGAVTVGSLRLICSNILPLTTTSVYRSYHDIRNATKAHWGYTAEYQEGFDCLDDREHDAVVPILTDRTLPDRWHFDPVIVCLILRLTGDRPGKYRRVGYAHFRFLVRRAEMENPIPFFDLMENRELRQLEEIPEGFYVELCEQEGGLDNYMIEII